VTVGVTDCDSDAEPTPPSVPNDGLTEQEPVGDALTLIATDSLRLCETEDDVGEADATLPTNENDGVTDNDRDSETLGLSWPRTIDSSANMIKIHISMRTNAWERFSRTCGRNKSASPPAAIVVQFNAVSELIQDG
jgi:hypothetical protein